jgi:YfiH family protein
VKQAIGAVHAGWRGTAQAIAAKTVDALAERFSSRPEDILAAIGPSIGPCCYEVDDTVFRAMSRAGGGMTSFYPAGREGRWMLDLAAVNRRQLEEKGIPSANISTAGLCTSCLPDRFFSHRRDGERTGRHCNFILLRDREK